MSYVSDRWVIVAARGWRDPEGLAIVDAVDEEGSYPVQYHWESGGAGADSFVGFLGHNSLRGHEVSRLIALKDEEIRAVQAANGTLAEALRVAEATGEAAREAREFALDAEKATSAEAERLRGELATLNETARGADGWYEKAVAEWVRRVAAERKLGEAQEAWHKLRDSMSLDGTMSRALNAAFDAADAPKDAAPTCWCRSDEPGIHAKTCPRAPKDASAGAPPRGRLLFVNDCPLGPNGDGHDYDKEKPQKDDDKCRRCGAFWSGERLAWATPAVAPPAPAETFARKAERIAAAVAANPVSDVDALKAGVAFVMSDFGEPAPAVPGEAPRGWLPDVLRPMTPVELARAPRLSRDAIAKAWADGERDRAAALGLPVPAPATDVAACREGCGGIRCMPSCGFGGCWHGSGFIFCSAACRDAGRPLHPRTSEPGEGTR